jgi:L,D-peptidoglycan transpeptidase YkuD (ErfK/YbiS/YcfS/YnhG family)
MTAMRRLGLLVAGLLLATDLLAPTAAAGAAATTPRVARTPAGVPTFADDVPADTTQVVRTISSRRWCRKVYCTLTQAWQKEVTGWHLVRQFRSTIGVEGWGKQREGDRRSPVGVFQIKVTFSTGSKAPGRMPWRRRKPTSVVSASGGPNYNTWVEIPGVTSGDRPAMRWGWVVDYNHVRLAPGTGTRPVPGEGSGIFYHTSKPGHRWAPTLGCTQVGSPKAMRWLVRWLRPGAHPRVVQRL